MAAISDNLKRVQGLVARAAERSGRSADAITLIVVSKTWPANVVQEAVDAGAVVLGENRVQEIQQKYSEITGSVSWHLIGHLQRNKVKVVLPLVDMIHSVDSLRLATEISTRSAENNQTTQVLVQVNTSGEDSKYGVSPDMASDFVGQVDALDGIDVAGIMTIGVFDPDPETARPNFVALREVRDRIVGYWPQASTLSMGMTNDFEVAIEEGATMVRVGTAIFGRRVV